MTNKKAIEILKTELECVNRQGINCDRDCKNCDLLRPTEDVVAGMKLAIEALECVNSSAFRDGYEKGRKDALQMANINNGVYCWHTCYAWENCERCRRIGNGDIDYFAELQEERNYD